MILTYYCAITMIIIAYLLGSIPSAVWIGKKYYGIDIREHGSKNAGTTNMLRVLGKRAALPVFALDFLKGFVAVTIFEMLKYDVHIGDNDLINLKIAAVIAAVLGHIFPIFAGFRGGKGVATLVGAITGIYPPVALLCFGVWFVVLMITHYVSLSSMVAGCCFPHLAQGERLDGLRRLLVRHRRAAACHPPQEHRAAAPRHRIENLHLEAASAPSGPEQQISDLERRAHRSSDGRGPAATHSRETGTASDDSVSTVIFTHGAPHGTTPPALPRIPERPRPKALCPPAARNTPRPCYKRT